MTHGAVSLGPSNTVGDALKLMLGHRVHNLPVVDEQGCFVGLFGLRLVLKALLPKAAQLNHYTLENLRFLPDEADPLHERILQVARHPVSEFLESEDKLTFCTPDTAFPELLQLLTRFKTSLPVVIIAGKQRKLVGMISDWDILTRLIAVTLFPDQAQSPAPDQRNVVADGPRNPGGTA